jgi:hypothetical protein
LQDADAAARAWLSDIFQQEGKSFGTGIAITGGRSFRLHW